MASTAATMAAPDMDRMAEHVRGLARLAGELLGDAGAGEDVAQEAAVRALRAERAPASTEGHRRWLFAIGRRLVLDEWRRRARREARERAAHERAAESLPSSAELAERAELAELLHRRVRALPPELAAVLMDRYVGELTPTEIAARDGVSPFTVKARLRRAKAALRADLERRGIHDARPWALSLAPLVARSPGAPATFSLQSAASSLLLTLGVLSMTKVLLASGSVAAAALLGVFLMTRDAPEDVSIREAADSTEAPARLAELPDESSIADPTEGVMAGPERAAAEIGEGGALEVQVRTVEGRPVDEYPVRLSLVGVDLNDVDTIYVDTDAEGNVRIPEADFERIRDQRPSTDLVVGLGTRTHEPVEVVIEGREIPAEPVVLVVDMMRIVVRAETPAGEPWTGRMGLNVRPDGMHYYTRAGSPPRIGWVPRGREYRVRVYRCGLWTDGEETFPAPLPDEMEREHLIRLGEAISGVSGRFVYPDGRPLEVGEYLQAIDRGRRGNGSRPVTVVEDGRFSFPLRLGESTGSERVFDFVVRGDNGPWAARVRFQVGEPGQFLDLGTIELVAQPLLVSGRIVMPEGIRAKGIRIWPDVWSGASGWHRHPDFDNAVWIDDDGEFALYGEDVQGPERLELTTSFREDAKDLVPAASMAFEPGTRGLEVRLVRPGVFKARVQSDLGFAGADRPAIALHTDPEGAAPEYELSRFDLGSNEHAIERSRIPPGAVRVELLAGLDGAPIESWGPFRIEEGRVTDAGLLGREVDPATIRIELSIPAEAEPVVRYGPAGERPLPYAAGVRDGIAVLPAGSTGLDVLVYGPGVRPVLLSGIMQDQQVPLEPSDPVAVVLDSLETLGPAVEDRSERLVPRIEFRPVEVEFIGCLPSEARVELRHVHHPGGEIAEVARESIARLPLPGTWAARAQVIRYHFVIFERDPPEATTPWLDLGTVSVGQGQETARVEFDLQELAPGAAR